MADTAVLEHAAGGGRLRLFEEQTGQRLVSAGHRTDLPLQGAVTVYGNGSPLLHLFTSAADDGKLSLRVDDGGPRPTETVLLEAASVDRMGEPKARPRLVLTDAETGDSIVMGFDENGPFVRLQHGRDYLRVALGEAGTLPSGPEVREPRSEGPRPRERSPRWP